MIEEITLSILDKLKSSDFLENEQAISKLEEVLQVQNSQNQRRIIAAVFPVAVSSKHESIQKKTVQTVSAYPTVLKSVLSPFRLSNQPQVRFWAYFTLIELGFLEENEVYQLLNSKESDEIRITAIDKVGKSDTPEAIKALLPLITDPSWLVKNAVKQLLISKGEGIYPIIQEFFQTSSTIAKYECMKLIPLVVKNSAGPLFQKMLESDPTGYLKPYIAAAFGEMCGEIAIKHLIEFINDDSDILREEALKALCKWREQALKPLLSVFASSARHAKLIIMRYLGITMGIKVVEFLKNTFNRTDMDTAYFILTAYSEVRRPEIVPEIIKYLNSDIVFIQNYAKSVLVSLGVISLEHLLRILDDENPQLTIQAIEVLGEIGSSDALRPLLYMIDNSKVALIKICAIEAFAKLQNFDLMANMLLLKLNDRDTTIRYTIVEALSKHPREAFLKDLVLSCFDRDKDIAYWSREIFKRRDYPGISSFLYLYDSSTELEQEKFVNTVSKYSPEQLDALLKEGSITHEIMSDVTVQKKVLRPSAIIGALSSMRDLLNYLREVKGSDLHLTSGLPPSIRVSGELIRTQAETVTPEKSRFLLYSIMNEEQKRVFEQRMELDFSHEIEDGTRFRVNVFMQKNGMAGVFRMIPNSVPTFKEIGLDESISEQICSNKSGLVLVTGATGSGKSTTLAALIDHINRTAYQHIMTIEDPIEFIHPHKRCVVNQRELGSNTLSFENALRSALREDPDVILVGEMRDPETIKLALTASETGHLVFSTLHTNSAYESVNRVVGSFPGNIQEMIRMQLSTTLRAIISQRLVPAYLADGRVLIYEVLIGTLPIRRCIRDNKLEQITSLMQTGTEDGMITLDKCLENAVIARRISYDEAYRHANDKKNFKETLGQRYSSGGPIMDSSPTSPKH